VKTHLHHVFEREGVHGRMALLAAHLHEAEDESAASVSARLPPQETGL